MPGEGPLALRTFAVVGSLAVVVSALDLSRSANTAAFLVLGVATAVALLVGPVINRAPRVPWYLVALACVLFAGGAGVRPDAVAAGGLSVVLPDLLLLPGYVMCLVGLGLLLRRRDGVRDVHATTDTLIVLIGAGSLAVTLLGYPASQVPGRPLWFSIASAVYPVLDVLLLCILVQIGFTSRALTWALSFMVAAIAALLVGDFVYAWLGTRGVLLAPPAVDVAYAVSFLLVGLTVLHPSMRALAVGEGRPVQGWSAARMIVVVPALSAPIVLLAVPGTPGALRPALAVLAVTGVALLLFRALQAVRALGRVQSATLHDATHDLLTGLPNRLFLEDWLSRQLARGRSLVLIFLDLDGFKLVNDSFGHATGDELLGVVAARLRTVTPDGAVLGRLGGDEFVMAFVESAHAPRSNSQELSARVLATISDPYLLKVAEVVVTGSIGIASSRADRPLTSAQDLVREADTAMYRAKDSGRGGVATFDDSMRASVRERLGLEQALRQALHLGQLSVHFQPVVDLRTELVIGHEALLRWVHPTRGDIPPDSFIVLAEETGLIVEIGDWVLERSLEVLARRRADGAPDLTVAVNVAGRQLVDPLLADRVTGALARHRLPASALKLEIVESAMLQDDAAVTRTLAALVEAGVALSMDDFGTGFSSLSYLRRLPVAEVKIDRSFVAGIVDSGADEEIVRAATAMARALRLNVVAEGIETLAQRDKLVGLGVNQGQGWLFGRPVAFDERDRAPASAEGGSLIAPSRRSMTSSGRVVGTGDS